jgi:ribosomal protein S18 acetylase RimI-like enzyme
MIQFLKNNRSVRLLPLLPEDAPALFDYFNELSTETRQRFGPHSFDWNTTEQICRRPPTDEWRVIVRDNKGGKIIAYAIIKKGYLLHDASRLAGYGLQLSGESDCTFAPSVADAWQSSGLGSKLFEYILVQIRQTNFRRIILWGGVQSTNEKAIRYYRKYGFRVLGEFEYNGKNYDMILEL